MDDWYDYPQYWEMAYAEDTIPEIDFFEAACRKYASQPVRRVLEPACGSGRLVVELARRGYRVMAFDQNQKSLDYLRRRLKRLGLSARVFSDDMTHFKLPAPIDAAYNSFSTFRHLLTEEAAVSHLQAVAAHLVRGGVYVLGLHLLPPDASEECTERWRAQRGKTAVCYTLRVTGTQRRKRLERLKVSLLVRRGAQVQRYATEFTLRLYNAAQLRQLLAKVPAFELCDVFDYCYEIDEPRKLNNHLADIMLVLRKR